MLTVMSGAIIAPALPAISAHYEGQGSEALQKLVLTMPALFIAVLAPLSGYLIDRLGRKQFLLGSLALYVLSGTAGFWIDDLYWLLISRAMLGIAVAGTMNTATTLIGDYFSGAERSQLMGVQASFMALGGVVFINLAGVLADWSWRAPFLLYGFAALILPLAAYYLWEPQRGSIPETREGKQLAAGSDPLKKARPLLVFIYLMGLVGMLVFYMIPVQVPFMFSRMEGISNTLIGFGVSMATVAGAIASFNYGWIKKWLNHKQIYSLCLLLVAIGYMVIGVSLSYMPILVGLAIAGLGLGLLMPNSSLWLVNEVEPAGRGRAVGGYTSAIFLGQFASPLVYTPLIEATSINSAFGITAVLMALGSLLISLVGVKGYRRF